MPVNILFIAANPDDNKRLGIGEEFKTIRDALRKSGRTDDFVFHPSMAATPKDLQDELLFIKPQIVHFSGHGEADVLAFAGQQDQTQWVHAESLAALFELNTAHVECVILNACYSDTVATAIAEHIPWLIGMTHEIEDNDAIMFSDTFYTALFSGKSYAQAFENGKVRLDLEDREARHILNLKSKDDTPRQTLVDGYEQDVCLVCPPALKQQGTALLNRLDELLASRFGEKNRYRFQLEENTTPDLPELLQHNACTLLLVGADSQIDSTDLSRAETRRLFWLETAAKHVPEDLKIWAYRLWDPNTDQALPPSDMGYRQRIEELAGELFKKLNDLRDDAEQQARLAAQRQLQPAVAAPELDLPDLTFFVDATPEDRFLLPTIETLLQREGAEYGTSIDPAYIESAEDVDKDLRSNFAYCDVFLLIYGQATSYAAIRHRLTLCRRLERERGKPLVAMIVHDHDPKPEKPHPGFRFNNLRVFECPPHAIERYLPVCLQELGDG